MKASMVLFLLGYLTDPSGARVLGRCTVAKMLYKGGLDYFEGYSLENWVCLAYYESKFNPSAVYENEHGGYSGFGLFQIREDLWCEHGRNLCAVSCSGRSPPFILRWSSGGCRATLEGWPSRSPEFALHLEEGGGAWVRPYPQWSSREAGHCPARVGWMVWWRPTSQRQRSCWAEECGGLGA
ncbi:Lysozyme-like protein 4 [Sciurus carolinensis]|uniref:Lysozyme-like protein 4 n=1 Tax=Sciurus carolinensis TaxID=30640 RepID=A0AA41N616_SCICA|nr:Lysozyme-like protein 4 [Sciurus carolinensis]